jgi:hypothetical protein
MGTFARSESQLEEGEAGVTAASAVSAALLRTAMVDPELRSTVSRVLSAAGMSVAPATGDATLLDGAAEPSDIERMAAMVGYHLDACKLEVLAGLPSLAPSVPWRPPIGNWDCPINCYEPVNGTVCVTSRDVTSRHSKSPLRGAASCRIMQRRTLPPPTSSNFRRESTHTTPSRARDVRE